MASATDWPRLAHKIWLRLTWLNKRHMPFAWISLFWVGFTDFYVYMVASGRFTDINTWEG